jgi:transmembrane sensor
VTQNTATRKDVDLFAQAADWHCLMEDGEPSKEQVTLFIAWLDSDHRHRLAYQAVENTWDTLGNASVDPRILRLRRAALETPRKTMGSGFRSFAIAASLLVAIAATVGLALRFSLFGADSDPDIFTTQVGERANITLPDGSSVVLNTASRIHVAYDAEVRRVQLLAGQAWFDVAKNQPRPFLVEAGNRVVTAHGTAFDVKLGAQTEVQVTLIEGRVSVDALNRSDSSTNMPEHVDLVPGEQLIAVPAKGMFKRRTDVTKATSWREGRIIFDDDTLEAAVAEVNRYSPNKVVLGDPRLKSLRLSGVFTAGHSDSFVETVTGNFPIIVTTTPDGQRLLLPAK